MKRLLAAFACLAMLCPPCLASDWVEEGSVQNDEAMLRAPLATPLNQQDIQTPETSEDSISTDLVDFTPGYSLAFGRSPDAAPTSKTLKGMSLPMAFADTEALAGVQCLSEDVSLEFRMDRLERLFGKQPTNGDVRDRLITLRKERGWPPILRPRRSLPDDFINAIGRGVTGGAKAGGKAIAKGAGTIATGAGAIVSGTGEFLTTPGVPELLMAGAILGIAIPLAIEAGKNNGGYSPLVYGFTNPYFVPSYAPAYSNNLGIGPTLITAPGSNSLLTPAAFRPYPSLWPSGFQPYSSNYSNPGWSWTNGYTKKNGTYVAPYRHTNADPYFGNNWSTYGNTNPFTGKRGTKLWP